MRSYIDLENYVINRGNMSSDISMYYGREPDDLFFIMKGRREFAIENGRLIPAEVEDYFADVEQCEEGIRVPIPLEYDYTNLDHIRARIKVKDIPFDAETIIVEYG